MATVLVNHNYGAPAALRYITAGASGVEAATIRIWKKVDFDLNNLAAAVGVTATNSDGNWVNPIALETGETYVVQFHKQGLYGPDKVEIVL